MISVYIASPYSSVKNKEKAVFAQVNAANQLINLGFNPYSPLLSHCLHIRKKGRGEHG
jgi:hypothetical protein